MTARRLTLLTLLLTFAFAPSAMAAQPGLVTGLNQTLPEAPTSQALGAKWHRLFTNWDVIESADNVYEQHIIDTLANRTAELKARGIKVLVVVSSTPAWARSVSAATAPPANPAKYGEVMGELSKRIPGVDAWEVWNEADENHFWYNGPDPVTYTALLKSAYTNLKAVDPNDLVVTTGMVAHNFEWIEALYAAGAKDHFDVVGAHTDTACLTAGPNEYYRDEQGRIGRYSFTGYREVHDIMSRHGDGHKKIWLTEIGWNTQSTAANSCADGDKAGTKPAGVSEAQQAEFLTQAYECLANDSYVDVAFWFSVQDIGPEAHYDRHLGLYRLDGSAKPALNAFKAAGSAKAKPCGGVVDHAAPQLQVITPSENFRFADKLTIKAKATDGGAGMRRIELLGNDKRIRFYNGAEADLSPWFGSKDLPLGRHRITIKAEDNALNVAVANIWVEKVRPDQLDKLPTKTTLKLGKIRWKGGRPWIKMSGTAKPVTLDPAQPFDGRVDARFYKKSGKRWKRVHLYSADAGNYRRTVKLYGPGTWRAQTTFRGYAPYSVSRSSYVTFKVRPR